MDATDCEASANAENIVQGSLKVARVGEHLTNLKSLTAQLHVLLTFLFPHISLVSVSFPCSTS